MTLKLVLCYFWYLTAVICSVPDRHISDGSVNFSLDEFDRATQKENNVSRLNLTVFYESLCPSSVLFFKNQFAKNWIPFYDYINVTLVPYGKATQTQDKEGNWTFTCQHGEVECYYNRIQVCAVSKMTDDKIKLLFKFISCDMSYMEKKKYGPKCAHAVNIEFSGLENCAKSKEGFDLLALYGDKTHNFQPAIQWVPTIVLNDKFNQTENELAISDLRLLLCKKLDHKPKICASL